MTLEPEQELQQFRAFLNASEQLVKASDLSEKLKIIARGIVDAGLFSRCLVTAHFRHGLHSQGTIGAAGIDSDIVGRLRAAPSVPARVYARLARAGRDLGNHFYYIPRSDVTRVIRSNRQTVDLAQPVSSFIDWHPDDMFICLLISANGLHCGTLSSDDPLSGRIPTSEALRALSLFASLASEVLEHDLSMRVDPLTGLFNGKFLADVLSQLDRSGEAFSALFADLDNLKPVNDRFGHELGDLYVRAGASALQHSVPKQAMIFRPYGDEFIIISRSRLSTLKRSVARLTTHMSSWNDGARYRHLKLSSEEAEAAIYRLSCSTGMAERRAGDPIPAQVVINLAEERMYLTKQAIPHGVRGTRSAQ